MLNISLKRRQVANAAYSKREVSVSEFIPYHYHWDAETIITKDRQLLQVIKLEGYAFETADDEDVDLKKTVRNSLFKSFSDGNFAIWSHVVRRRRVGFPDGRMPNAFAGMVNEQWRRKQEGADAFINELYITIVRKEDTAGFAKLGTAFNFLTEVADERQRAESLREAHKELKDATHRLLATFRDYSPRLLGCYETPNGVYSEPLQFLGMLINGGNEQPMLVPNTDLSHYLPINRLYFGSRAVEMRSLTKTRFGAMISVKDYAPATSAGIMDAFLQLPFEFIISQSYGFVNRQAVIGSMNLQQRRMMQSQDPAFSQVIDITTARDMVMSGHVAMGEHHLTIMPLEDNLDDLEDAVSMVTAEMINVGITPTREMLIMEQCYWAQLPGNFAFVGRKAKINSLNYSGFTSLHNYPVGRIRGNHWGDAVTVFGTSSGTPYFFNFHSRDVGHTTIIGPTGAGKTVLMNFLCAQAQKFNCRLFMFDKDRGAEIFVRAINGVYNVIQPGEKCGFNPLQLPDTIENRNFLVEWLGSLVSYNGEALQPEEVELLRAAMEGNYKLAKHDRKLSNIAPFLGMEKPGSIASRLKMWYGSGQYAKLFDNVQDTLDFDTARTFGFEMGEVLVNRATLGPVLLYLFHKINLSLDGTPTMIVLDEAWALIDNKIFASKIKDWLKTLRKLNAMVIFATQSVEDATNSAISDTLIQQTGTQIFLPNPKATEVYRTAFMLSQREYNLLKTTDSGSRFFLIKQNKDTVVARLDLSGMNDAISVFSARAETIGLLDEIRAEFGDDPKDWLPVFYDRVKRMKD